MVEHPLQAAVREAGGRGLPVPHARPPVSAVVVPAGVDAEVLRPGLGGRVDQGKQLLGGRIAHQRVHVVVEDHRQIRADERTPDGAAMRGEGGDRPLPTVPRHGDRGGHGRELRTRAELDRPVVIDVVGSAGDHRDLVHPHPATVDLPAPGPVVLDLPGQRASGGGVVDHGGGQDLAGRPGRGADRRAVGARLDAPVRRRDPTQALVVPQLHAAPTALRTPAVLRGVQHQVVQALTVVEQAAQGQRADHLHDLLVVGGVPYRAVGLQGGHLGVRGQGRGRLQTGQLVALHDDQADLLVVHDRAMGDVTQPLTDSRAGEARVVEAAAVAEHQQLHQRLAGRRRPLPPRDVQAVDRHRSVAADTDHDTDLRVTPADARHERRT